MLACTYRLLIVGLVLSQVGDAESIYRDSFDSPLTSWVQDSADCAFHVRKHERSADRVHSGVRSEHLQLVSARGTQIIFRYGRLPRITVTEDGYVSLWLKASRSGAQLLVRVVLPHEPPGDPSESARVVVVPGPTYEEAGIWQELRVQNLRMALERQLRLVRAQLRRDVDDTDAYVDQIMLNLYSGPGVYDIYIDDLTAYPVTGDARSPATEISLQRLDADEAPLLRITGEQIRVGDVPRLPVLISSTDASLMPHLDTIDGYVVRMSPQEPRVAESRWALPVLPLPPLGPPTVAEAEMQAQAARIASRIRVAGWIVDSRTRLPLPTTRAADERAELLERVRTVVTGLRRVDDSRPVFLLADSMFSRLSHLADGLVFAANPVGTTLELSRFCDLTAAFKALARPGTFCWGTVPLRSVGIHGASFHATYEQIRLLTYGCLIAGARGIIFDAGEASIQGTDRGLGESVALCTIELRLLEPFIAAAGPPEPLRLSSISLEGAGEREFESERQRLQRVLATGRPQNRRQPAVSDEFRGAVFRLPRASLVLLSWTGPHAQIVPGQLAANELRFVVEGVPETALAWQITPAGIVPLARRRVAGGVEVTIRGFDTAAAVVLSTDRAILSELSRRAEKRAGEAAHLLATVARQRVEQLEATARSSGRPAELPVLIGRAKAALARADGAMSKSALLSYESACEALRACRLAERAVWDMHRRGADPAISPYLRDLTLAPKHTQLLNHIRTNLTSVEHLLPEGDFENPDRLVQEGWSQAVDLPDGLTGAVYVVSGSGLNRSRALRLQATPAAPVTGPRTAVFDGETGLTVYSPKLRAPSTGIFVIEGRVRVAERIRPDSGEFLVYDTLYGSGLAYHFTRPTQGWQHVTLLRPADSGQTLRLVFTLRGAGAVLLDNFRVGFLSDSAATTPPSSLAERPHAAPLK